MARREATSELPAARKDMSQGMLDWSRCEAVERDPSKLDGAWIFKGTRVPVRALFENIEDGASIDQFLEWFPGVPRCHVEVVLEHVARSLAKTLA